MKSKIREVKRIIKLTVATAPDFSYLYPRMETIAEILLQWYARHGRDLPWRRTRDPYRI